jgi:hypothetical protein
LYNFLLFFRTFAAVLKFDYQNNYFKQLFQKNTMKFVRYLSLLSIIVSNYGCLNNKQAPNKFHFSPIKNILPKSAVHYSSADSLSPSRTCLIGKFKFGDTITFTNSNIAQTDILHHHRKDFLPADTLNSDGLQLKIDDSRELFMQDSTIAYPAYLINETSTDKVCFTDGGFIFSAQAVDTYLIEYSPWFDCNMGFEYIRIHPHESLVFSIRKYTGSEKARLFLRVDVGIQIYVSTPYNGSINPNQAQNSKSNDYKNRGYPDNLIGGSIRLRPH